MMKNGKTALAVSIFLSHRNKKRSELIHPAGSLVGKVDDAKEALVEEDPLSFESTTCEEVELCQCENLAYGRMSNGKRVFSGARRGQSPSQESSSDGFDCDSTDTVAVRTILP
ncbi:hypothetical protein M8J76_016565 [Diaphorina citri]|nr:hypothetical protein M8J75_009281 [Diaphorina citri]KAI5750548.1 hypothetical protein M8J76_016565 [Diaphorina citri]